VQHVVTARRPPRRAEHRLRHYRLQNGESDSLSPFCVQRCNLASCCDRNLATFGAITTSEASGAECGDFGVWICHGRNL